MSVWTIPKTDWISTDFINTHDYNRIVGNLYYLKDLIDEVAMYNSVSIDTMEESKVVSDLPYPRLYNVIEQNLEKLNKGTYDFDIGDTKTFYANQSFIDYEELNRIESWSFRLYETLLIQKALQRNLKFKLGGTRMFDVPRTSNIDDLEEIAYRLPLRLGEEKGEYV